jgi:protein gp37
MGDKTGIEWTDATWPIVQGCDYASPGCTHCYVPRTLWRLMHNPSLAIAEPLQDLVRMHENGMPVFTGALALREDRLTWPLKWKKPRRIFVPSHGDIFHKDVPDAFLDKIFAVMALCPQHTFQVLTKRAARMNRYLTTHRIAERVAKVSVEILPLEGDNALVGAEIDKQVALTSGWDVWPRPNIWLGVSVEDQARADERIPLLLETPAAKRFLSCEPLLGAVDLTALETNRQPEVYEAEITNALTGRYRWELDGNTDASSGIGPRINWVIGGFESGPNARPGHPGWGRSLRDQCAAAGVAFFWKQNGEYIPAVEGDDGTRMYWDADDGGPEGRFAKRRAKVIYPFGDDQGVARVGKKAAGRLLDGREWNEVPQP